MASRILLTGAAGKAASGIRPLLREAGYELVLQDLIAPAVPPSHLERLVLGDLCDPSTIERAYSDGVDLVVHLGGHSGERGWDEVAEVNITGTQRILAGAQRHGIDRILLASSTHAVGYWPTHVAAESSLPARPDSFYGVSKVAMEALGSVYADRHDMTVVAARIGTVEARPSNLRSLSTWLSFSDLARLVRATLTTEIGGFHLVWGVSNNTRGWFPLDAGRRIGYDPVDDAERYVVDIDETAHSEVDTLLGGSFTDRGRPLGVRR